MMQSPRNTVLLQSEAFDFKVVRLHCFIQVWGELCLDRDAKLSDCGRLRSNKKIGPSDWSVRMASSLGWSSNLLDLAGERAQSVTENGNYTVCVSQNWSGSDPKIDYFSKRKNWVIYLLTKNASAKQFDQKRSRFFWRVVTNPDTEPDRFMQFIKQNKQKTRVEFLSAPQPIVSG